jgi:site-specific DNA-cytosine methylase
MSNFFSIELFPCSGGMAEGFRRAGVVFDLAFDKDADAIASYTANHGHAPIQMDVRDLVRLARSGWRPTQPIDLLVADPPCTPWSRAGKRMGVEDERDMLVETCDLIALLRPSAYLIGNVPGLNDAPSWHIVQKHIGGLARHGYCVADYAELDAAAYGVPQHRVRPFWFGHLEGACLRWPEPTHGGRPGALPGLGLAPFVTCRDALAHLSASDLGRPVRMRMRAAAAGAGRDESRCSAADAPAKVVVAHDSSKGGQILAAPHPRHPLSEEDAPSRTIRTNGGRAAGAASMLALNERHPSSELDAPAKVIPASMPGNGGATLVVREPNPNQPPMGPDESSRTITAAGRGHTHLLEWPWDRPSTTIARDERIPPPGHHASNSYMSSPNAIVLSEKAAAILQGFPEGWVFAGKTKRSRWSQLGQAMPPGLAEPVARAIVEQMRSARVVLPAPRHRSPVAIQLPIVAEDARSASALPEG